ncbi:MAG: DmsE family decaheme c-type cytochrome [Nitrospiraceae bacterium]|nr:DmsE family decaheme c-type cytochrome [Nitrospiraceae bacterium]
MKRCILWMIVAGTAVLLLSCAGERIKQSAAVTPREVLATVKGANYVGSEACADCHEKIARTFKTSIHGRIATYEIPKGTTTGCEACHGPASRHVDSEDPKDILSYKHLNPAQSSAVCLQCHTMMHWRSNEHALSDVGCLNCHTVHSAKAKHLLAQSESKGCYTCHADIRAKFTYPSHHPVREQETTGRRRMQCSDCHDPHGSSLQTLKSEERINDLCYKCHASKQGPFVFEHPPVVEDCTICHEPHGTTADNLLKENEPFLCLQCHEAHFHSARNSNTDLFVSPGVNSGFMYDVKNKTTQDFFRIQAHKDGWKSAFMTRCTRCHNEIHGSDLPSQSVPGRGKALTR